MKKNRNGFKIVLTAGRAVMSESFGEIGPNFVSAFPPKYLPNPFIKWVFPLKSYFLYRKRGSSGV